MKAIVLSLILICVSAASGFAVGTKHTKTREVQLVEQLKDLTEDHNHLQETTTELRAELQTATLRYEQLQEQLADEMPSKELKSLIDLVRQQLTDGIDAKRLEHVVRLARPPSNCTTPETKRFVIRTQASTGPISKVSFGGIVIKGTGMSARNANRKPEAWFDPSKKVQIQFVKPDGKVVEKKDILPVRHSMVIEDREYRFTIEEGVRSFVKVTYDSCAYP